MARMKGSRVAPPMSLRSKLVVAGRTMSAWRASGFHQGSWTMMVSGLRLVVMKGIAARPIDQVDVREDDLLAIEIDGRSGVEQHVGDAGDGDVPVDRILAFRNPETARGVRRLSDIALAGIAETDPAAGKADLAQH